MTRGLVVAVVLGALAGLAGALVGGRRKVQAIRVADVAVIGPLMVAAAVASELPRPARVALAFAGAATVTFNGTVIARVARGGRP